MAFGFRPATPGTIVVLAATVLLVLVSVSVPITKSIWFLKANVQVSVDGIDINGVVTLGCWGYCIGDNCTSSKLGYNLDILKLVGGSGSIAGVSTAVLKWITYLLILHPIAAALAAVATILGLLAHLRGFGATCFTTCVASLAATVALLAFVFDIVVFLIAKKRIEAAASGESAELGNAVWMTLAAMVLLLSSGFFFGCGACLIRRQRHEKEVSDLYRPQVDENYGSKMRNDAYATTPSNKINNSRASGNLPAFAEYEHEREYEKDPEDQFGGGGYANQYNNAAAAAGGYSSRPNQQLRFASNGPQDYAYQNAGTSGGAGYAGDMVGAGASGGAAGANGAGARLAAEARAQRGLATQEDLRLLQQEPNNGNADRALHHQSSVEPFTGMYDPTAQSRSEHEQQDSYSANPYYNPSQMGGGASVYQQDQPTSPSRLVGPRPLSTGPIQQQQTGPRSPTYSAGQHSQQYHQYGGQQQQQQQSSTYGSGAYPPYPVPEHQSTSPPPQQHYYQQQGGSGATDMYGAPTKSYDRY